MNFFVENHSQVKNQANFKHLENSERLKALSTTKLEISCN